MPQPPTPPSGKPLQTRRSNPMTPRHRFRILLALTILLALNAFAFLQNLPTALAGETDFRSLYAAGAIVRTHQAGNLYNYDLERTTQNNLISPHPGALPFLYPPYAALPLVPLSALPYRIAYFTFLSLNIALLLAAARTLHPHLPTLTNLFPPILTLIFLAFLPVAIALYQGQVSLILLVCFVAAYASLEKKKPFQAGLLLSLALIKFHVVLPVILLYAIWRNWPLIQGFLTGAATLALLCLIIQGPQGLHLYTHTLLAATSTGAIGSQNPYTVFSAKMPNLHGLFYPFLGSSPWTTPLVLLISAAVLLWTARQPPSLPRALTAALLVSYHLHMHDLTLLLLPLILTLEQVLQAHQSKPPQPNRLQLTTALLWFTSPLILYLIATGTNGLLAPAMLPFLLPAGCPIHTKAKGGDTP